MRTFLLFLFFAFFLLLIKSEVSSDSSDPDPSDAVPKKQNWVPNRKYQNSNGKKKPLKYNGNKYPMRKHWNKKKNSQTQSKPRNRPNVFTKSPNKKQNFPKKKFPKFIKPEKNSNGRTGNSPRRWPPKFVDPKKNERVKVSSKSKFIGLGRRSFIKNLFSLPKKFLDFLRNKKQMTRVENMPENNSITGLSPVPSWSVGVHDEEIQPYKVEIEAENLESEPFENFKTKENWEHLAQELEEISKLVKFIPSE